MSEEGYRQFRGKCRELSEALAAKNPTLRVVRGHYYCPTWGEQPHWWCVDTTTGKVVDPTATQFPSNGIGVYVEFNGILSCEYCGKEFRENEGYYNGRHCYCSGDCLCRDVL